MSEVVSVTTPELVSEPDDPARAILAEDLRRLPGLPSLAHSVFFDAKGQPWIVPPPWLPVVLEGLGARGILDAPRPEGHALAVVVMSSGEIVAAWVRARLLSSGGRS